MGRQESIHQSSPAGDFDRTMLEAISGPGPDTLFGAVSQADIPALVQELHETLDREYSKADRQNFQDLPHPDSLIMRCEYLSKNGFSSPECIYTFLSHLSEPARAYIEFLGEHQPSIRQFLFSETAEDQLKPEIVDFCVKSIAENPDKFDRALIAKLLEAQKPCLVSEEDMKDPSRRVRGGILGEWTEEDFLSALRAKDAQILVTKNAASAFGWAIYHGTGSCAPSYREFVDRACRVLSQEANQIKLEAIFGARFNPQSVATVDTALIDPLIDQDFDEGGAETSRSLVYDALVYYILHEFAVSKNPPEWTLVWVRSWPNENLAIHAHKKVLFHDVGIELPFFPPGSSHPEYPETMKLKLMLCHMKTQFDAQGNPRPDVDPGQRDDPESYGSVSLLQRQRMLKATQQVHLTDFDIA